MKTLFDKTTLGNLELKNRVWRSVLRGENQPVPFRDQNYLRQPLSSVDSGTASPQALARGTTLHQRTFLATLAAKRQDINAFLISESGRIKNYSYLCNTEQKN